MPTLTLSICKRPLINVTCLCDACVISVPCSLLSLNVEKSKLRSRLYQCEIVRLIGLEGNDDTSAIIVFAHRMEGNGKCNTYATCFAVLVPWLPDGYSRIFRSYVFGPLGSGFWTMAPLRCTAKFDPFLSLDCAPTPSTLAQSKERKGSNFAIWPSVSQ